MQLEHRAVLQPALEVDAGMAPKSPQRATVGDDEDPFAAVPLRDSLQCCDDPGAVLLAGLAVMALVPREALVDLRARQPRPGADIDLAESAVDHHGNAVRPRDDDGSLVCPPQVARVDGVEGIGGQAARELACLSAPGLVQRWVGPALEAAFPVPVGLAVAREEDSRHGD